MGCFQSSEAGGASKGTAEKYKAKPESHQGEANPTSNTRAAAPPEPTKPSLDEALQELYEPVHQLGAGGTGESWLVKDRETSEYLAIKLIKRPIPSVLQPMMLREIEIQGELGEGHLNIVKSNYAILTAQHLCIAMEYASGGSLTQYVTNHFPKSGHGLFLSEMETLYFFKQIVLALEFCHTHNVAHRDLKLDNTLLDGSDPPYIKICDFGFAKSWGENAEEANMFTQIGTPVYMSPEVIRARDTKSGYDPKSSDIWSAGVLLYVMLLGSFPFDHDDYADPNSSQAQQEVLSLQSSEHWSDHPSNPKGVEQLTPEVNDLLNKIFVVDSSQRINLKDIKAHPWYMQPLEPKYAEALRILEEEQGKLLPMFNTNKIDKALLDLRHKRLEKMVGVSGTSPGTAPPPSLPGELGPGKPFITRVNLMQSEVMSATMHISNGDVPDLSTIAEEPSHRGPGAKR
mmetsp:Transcript_20348/g.56393  ORF Transcript_20348/g.56393 Transcript_20348/m.56393 type:complete len:457 (-) Transcript_20348:375-1745(-)